jgi:hypothetical protein
MTFNEKVIALKEKVENQYEDFRKTEIDTKTKEEILDGAYKYIHYYEVYAFICDIQEDEEDCEFVEEIIDEMLKTEKNLMEQVYESWMNYHHQEYYNFFTYECLADIIRYAFR